MEVIRTCRFYGEFAGILQVFCRQKSGNLCPVSVCLFSSLERGACRPSSRMPHGQTGILRNAACFLTHVAEGRRHLVGYTGLARMGVSPIMPKWLYAMSA
jgi:hypothetical protein